MHDEQGIEEDENDPKQAEGSADMKSRAQNRRPEWCYSICMLEELLPGKKPISCKWVYKTQYKASD